MSIVANPPDIATYLGMSGADIDTDRATLLINLAEDQAAGILRFCVDDLPSAARGVVLSMAARAYTNIQGITAEMAGPYQVSRPSGGGYSTKAERAALRRLAASGGGAFSIDMLDPDRFGAES